MTTVSQDLCRITINGDRQLTAPVGRSLFHALADNNIFVPSACNGRAMCGFCKTRILSGAGPIHPDEERHLSADDRSRGMRLACRTVLSNDLAIELPAELLGVREFQATCSEIVPLTADIRFFRLTLKNRQKIGFVPGQYIQLRVPAYPGNAGDVQRAYSIASDPADHKGIELIIRRVPGGISTTWAFDHLQVGHDVTFNGPFGEFRLSDTDAPIIFIAGGSGMSPVKAMLHHMKNHQIARPAVFYFGVNTPEEQFFTELMCRFQQDVPNFRFVPVVLRPGEPGRWTGQTGLVTDALRRDLSVEAAARSEAYLCGSPGMIDASIQVLNDLGMSSTRIFYDKFT
jgi:Na+-transporting NADH:ubiquinone oxidoreductase subunit F